MADLGAIGVESRFAVLNKKKKKPKKEESNVNGFKTSVGTKTAQTQNQPKKKPQTQPPLVGLPGNHIPEDPEEKKKRKKKKKLPNQTSQWDEWRQKDEEVVDKEFDKSIQKALTLSKLEQKRRILVPAVISTSEPSPPVNSQPDSNHRTSAANTPKLLDDLIDGRISHEKSKSLLAERDKEISELRLQLDELAAEMKRIKLRNKSLCTIISEGEIKSKAELILELESSIKVKDELLAEVNRLSTQLEQERSKVHLLTSGNDKTNKMKKHRLKSESEK
uniref:G kinase-anchoring protein 1 n=1 Tax=Cacopsylla melanoneura TaxID=428564 RepID=A0A8D8LIJ8_9HEMI